MHNHRITFMALCAILFNITLLTGMQAQASSTSSDVVTLECKNTGNQIALDLSSLGLIISKSTPIGTVLSSGTFTVTYKCAIQTINGATVTNVSQIIDGLAGEVYFKRKAVDSGSLGYGLTIYTGYNSDLGDTEASIPTGQTVTTFAVGSAGTYSTLSLTVPYEIVRTSMSTTESNLTIRNYIDLFSIGSETVSSSSDEITYRLRVKSVELQDETCSVSSDINQTVPLGSYTADSSTGLGSGIGQTSSNTAFNIVLDCNNLLSGSFDVMMQFDGTSVTGLSDAGVIALNDTSSATGVGVQILDGNQNPITLATPFAVASYPLSSSIVTVPLYARYYQTADHITSGEANAVATYTISYQ